MGVKGERKGGEWSMRLEDKEEGDECMAKGGDKGRGKGKGKWKEWRNNPNGARAGDGSKRPPGDT